MYFENVDFSDVGMECYKKCPIVEGLEAYKEEIQAKGMSKEAYRQVELLAPGALNAVDPMRLSITPSWIQQQVAVESLGRTIGRYSLIAVIGAMIVKLITWIYNKFKKKDGADSSNDLGKNISNVSKQLKDVDVDKLKREDAKINDAGDKLVSKEEMASGFMRGVIESSDFSPEFKKVCNKAMDKVEADRKAEEAKAVAAELEKNKSFQLILLTTSYEFNCDKEPKFEEGLKILNNTNEVPNILSMVYVNAMEKGVSTFDAVEYRKFADHVLSTVTIEAVAHSVGEYTKMLTSIPENKASGAAWIRKMRLVLKSMDAQLASGFKYLNATSDGTGYDLTKFQDSYNSYAEELHNVLPFSEALVKCGSLSKLDKLISKTAYTGSFGLFDTSDKCLKFFRSMYKSAEGTDENSPEQIEAALEKLKAAGVDIDQDLANSIKSTSMNIVQYLNATRQLAKLHYRVLKVCSRCWRK